jgi:hypothetical protein
MPKLINSNYNLKSPILYDKTDYSEKIYSIKLSKEINLKTIYEDLNYLVAHRNRTFNSILKINTMG